MSAGAPPSSSEASFEFDSLTVILHDQTSKAVRPPVLTYDRKNMFVGPSGNWRLSFKDLGSAATIGVPPSPDGRGPTVRGGRVGVSILRLQSEAAGEGNSGAGGRRKGGVSGRAVQTIECTFRGGGGAAAARAVRYEAFAKGLKDTHRRAKLKQGLRDPYAEDGGRVGRPVTTTASQRRGRTSERTATNVVTPRSVYLSPTKKRINRHRFPSRGSYRSPPRRGARGCFDQGGSSDGAAPSTPPSTGNVVREPAHAKVSLDLSPKSPRNASPCKLSRSRSRQRCGGDGRKKSKLQRKIDERMLAFEESDDEAEGEDRFGGDKKSSRDGDGDGAEDDDFAGVEEKKDAGDERGRTGDGFGSGGRGSRRRLLKAAGGSRDNDSDDEFGGEECDGKEKSPDCAGRKFQLTIEDDDDDEEDEDGGVLEREVQQHRANDDDVRDSREEKDERPEEDKASSPPPPASVLAQRMTAVAAVVKTSSEAKRKGAVANDDGGANVDGTASDDVPSGVPGARDENGTEKEPSTEELPSAAASTAAGKAKKSSTISSFFQPKKRTLSSRSPSPSVARATKDATYGALLSSPPKKPRSENRTPSTPSRPSTCKARTPQVLLPSTPVPKQTQHGSSLMFVRRETCDDRCSASKGGVKRGGDAGDAPQLVDDASVEPEYASEDEDAREAPLPSNLFGDEDGRADVAATAKVDSWTDCHSKKRPERKYGRLGRTRVGRPRLAQLPPASPFGRRDSGSDDYRARHPRKNAEDIDDAIMSTVTPGRSGGRDGGGAVSFDSPSSARRGLEFSSSSDVAAGSSSASAADLALGTSGSRTHSSGAGRIHSPTRTGVPVNPYTAKKRAPLKVVSGNGSSGGAPALPRKSGNGIPGVQNLGNTCYLSASLQTLFSLPDFLLDLARLYNRGQPEANKVGGEKEKGPPLPSEEGVDEKENTAVGATEKALDEDKMPLTRALLEVAAAVGAMPEKAPAISSIAALSSSSSHSTAANPKALKKQMDALTDKFAGYEQRDAHEFLSDLVDFLHDELSDFIGTSNLSSSLETKKSDEASSTDAVGRSEGREETDGISGDAIRGSNGNTSSEGIEASGEENQSPRKPDETVCTQNDVNTNNVFAANQRLPTDEFFRLNVRVCLQCDSCGYSRSKEEMYRHLSVEVGEDSSTGLKQFFQPEKRELKCEKCEEGQTATQKIEVISRPKALLLHFKRFIVTQEARCSNITSANVEEKENKGTIPPVMEMVLRKNKAKISLEESLSISSYTDSDRAPPVGRYHLRSVVHHVGSTAFSGHYTSCARRKVKNSDDGTNIPSCKLDEEQWVMFDDRVGVKKTLDYVTKEGRNQQNCYMALYELR